MIKRSGLFALIALLVISCSEEVKKAEDSTKSISISVKSGSSSAEAGEEVIFVVKNDKDADLSKDAKFFVDGKAITGSKHTFSKVGTAKIHATYKTFKSPEITMNITEKVVAKREYKSRFLVQEFTGTWCGFCAEAILEVKRMHDKYPKTVVPISFHSGSGAEFDFDDYKAYGVKAPPETRYDNQADGSLVFDSEMADAASGKDKRTVGLAINYDLKNKKATVRVGYGKPTKGENKLVVYVVEDKLVKAQANYGNKNPGSLGYKKGHPIENYEHNHVVRAALTKTLGDLVDKAKIKNDVYTTEYSLPSAKKFKNINNTRIVAYVLDSKGKSINVQTAKVNENKKFD